ncbi:hypothetical protein Thivi_1837 [Thiocystis violascens DSM 198]|uniref:Uncharacterized protein n=2 Tax=Thiocystis violascens TaxID=73141 RepID=I3Y9Z0_THIV6|nr:hypothetical protein Thivi_1837 [Thiocystis violascens DSM 198]
MTPDRKITGSDEAWDRRELGADSNFVVVADDTDDDAIDAALDLQPISIRLQKSLIEDFKMIAQLNDIGYQPLMRQVLARFADSEKKRILRQVVSDTLRRRKEDDAEDAQSKTGTHG